MGVNAHISEHIFRPTCPLCIHVCSPPFGSSKITVTVRFSHSFGKHPAFTGLAVTLKDNTTLLLLRTMEDASTRRTHTDTPPGATASAGGDLAHTHHPTRHLLNTTPCCAHAASHTPRWLRCKALLQQQIFIAAALLYNAPHNTQASCASALAGQMPALPPANLHAALSVAPGRGALLFALLCAHHDVV